MTIRPIGRQSPRANVRQFVRMIDTAENLVGLGFLVNVSAGGAKIETKSPEDIPEVFMLLLSVDGKVRRDCTVVWRGAGCLGVKFAAGGPGSSLD
ncbi:MAG TPA: PilZ domain-containing protein [Pseudorhodoplanes sp.]|jgi:hypothetical protein|nr:PilZ domain-containing protein [Pseudorhodoplanes sp.]